MKTDIQYPNGTVLYLIPIRFWEKRPLEKLYVTPNKGVNGNIIPSFNGNHVYCYSPEFSHNGYFAADRVFLTEKEANEARYELKKNRHIEENKKLDEIMKNIFKRQ